MTIPEIIVAFRKAELPFLVIGGYAVIAHGYSRATFDLDLMARRAQRQQWIAKTNELGFKTFQESEIFVQLKPQAAGFPLDLMFVNDKTFDGMMAAAQEIRFVGVVAQMVSLDHLIALKLHILKQNLKHRTLKDADDLITLINKNGLDIRTRKYKELFLKYGDTTTYEKIIKATSPG